MVFSKSDSYKSEYSAAVVRVPELTPIEGSDFLAKTNIFGTQIVVRKDQVKEGDIMIYAANETQLNERFLSVNNLFEISCREKNANAEEVAAIMAEYEPIKAKADVKRNEAKNIKGKMEAYTKKSQKIRKEIQKKEKNADGKEGEEYAIIMQDVPELRKKADEYVAEAMALTTVYTNLKKEVEEIVKSGEHIVAEAKKHCGFFNKYGRVRCLTLKGCPSFGVLFAPEDLIKFDSSVTMEDILAYEGQEFDTVNGELFVKVYIPPVKEQPVRRNNQNRAQKRVIRFNRMIDGEFFLHYESTQLAKVIQFFRPEDVVDISVKMHGTSCVFANVHVKEPVKLPFFQRIFNKIVDVTGLFKKHRIRDWEIKYGPVYSSRRVITNEYINTNKGPGFYEKDIYSEWGDKIYPYLEEGMTAYGEICGYYDNKLTKKGKLPIIQTQYDYGCKYVEGEVGESIFMPYRITTTNEDGSKTEWEVPDVREWTIQLIERMKERDDDNWKYIHPIDLLYHGALGDLYPDLDVANHWHENLLERMKNDKEHFGMEENEPMCTHYEVPREGVCLRKEGDEILENFKLKTIAFAFGEAIRYDSGDVDIEAAEGYGDES